MWGWERTFQWWWIGQPAGELDKGVCGLLRVWMREREWVHNRDKFLWGASYQRPNFGRNFLGIVQSNDCTRYRSQLLTLAAMWRSAYFRPLNLWSTGSVTRGLHLSQLSYRAVWLLIFCINLTRLWGPIVWSSISPHVAVEGFFLEVVIGTIPWRREWQPTPVFLPGESQGWRSLVGYSPKGRKE